MTTIYLQARQAENNLVTLTTTHERATLTIKNILEEERQKQKSIEEMAAKERQKIHRQSVQAEENGRNDPEIQLKRKDS